MSEIQTTDAPPAGGTPVSTAVATRRDPGPVPAEIIERFPALDPDAATEMAELMAENFREDESLSVTNLTMVKVPSGSGAAMFSVIDGDKTDAVKTIKGVVIAWMERRNYWESAEVTGAAPDCFSRDGIVAVEGGLYAAGSAENPSGTCAACPMSQWTPVADGKDIPGACKPQIALLLMVEGEAFPYFVQVPRTSIKPFKDYRATVFKKLKGIGQIVTELTLTKQKKEGVPDFYTITFNMGEDLGKSAKAVALQVGQIMLPILNNVRAEAAAEDAATGAGTVSAEAGISLDDDEVVTTA